MAQFDVHALGQALGVAVESDFLQGEGSLVVIPLIPDGALRPSVTSRRA